MKGDLRERKKLTQCDLITVDLFRLSLGITNAITQVGKMRERMRDRGRVSRVGGGRLVSDGNRVDLIRKHDLSPNNL